MSRRDVVKQMGDAIAGRRHKDTPLRAKMVDAGMVATLRRLDPGNLGPDATTVYLFLTDCGVAIDSMGPPLLARWVLIAHIIALARGHHDSRVPIGKGLQAIDLSEARLNQLLSADASVLADLLPRLARRIGSSGEGMDLMPLAELALADTNEGLEQARLTIARSFVIASQKDTSAKDKRTAA